MNEFHNTNTIAHVELSVTDLDISREFYKNVIRLDEIESTNTFVVLGQKGKKMLTLIKTRHKNRNQEGLYHIAFLLKNDTQLANWLYSNREINLFEGFSDHGVSKAIYLRDPDGIGIEVYVDRESSTWEREGEHIKMVTEPLDLDDLLSNVTEEKTYDVIIGHLHLQTKSIDQMSIFYNALGLDLMLDLNSAQFMSYNGYHHHIAFNRWQSFSMEAHDQDYSDILSYEIVYESDERLQEHISSLEKYGIPINSDGSVIDPSGVKIYLKGVKK